MQVLRMLIFFLVGICCALSWLLPNHYQPWVAAYQSFLAFAALMLALAYFLVAENKLKINKRALFLLPLSLFPFFQFWFGKLFFFGDAVVVAAYILGLFFSICIGCSLRKLQFEFFLTVILFSVLASVGISFSQWALLNGNIWMAELPPNARPFANFSQPNNFSTFIGFGLVATVYLKSNNRLSTVTSCILTIFLSFGAALAQSKTMIVSLLVLALLAVLKVRSDERSTLVKYLLVFSVFYAFFLWGGPKVAEIMGFQVGSIGERGRSLAPRLEIWLQMARAVVEQPWLGYGWIQVSSAQILNSFTYPISILVGSSHNILLDLFVWVGVPIGVVITCFFARLMYPLVGRNIKGLELFALSGFVFFAVHSMTEFPYEYAFLLFPAGVFLGVALQGTEISHNKSVPARVLATTVFASAFLFASVLGEYFYLESAFREARFEAAKFSWSDERMEEKDMGILTQLEGLNAVAKNPAKADMSERDIALYNEVFHRFPYNAFLLRYIEVLVLNGKGEQAEMYLQLLKDTRGRVTVKQAQERLKAIGLSDVELEFLFRRIGGTN